MNHQGLAGKVLKGGISLTLRQIVITGLSLINILVVARLLGPDNYGIVSIAFGIFYFLVWTSKLGLNVYLVRQPNLPELGAEIILTFYNTIGLCACLLLAGIAPLFGWWTEQEQVTAIMRLLMFAVWFDMISCVSISMLERNLRFSEVGIIEALSQLLNYIVAILLVIFGFGYWGPIWGTVVGFLSKALLASRYYPIRWHFHWEWIFVKSALRYGSTYISSEWVSTTKQLIVPLLASRLLGVSSVGIISISVRLAQQLTILRFVIRRMAISVMSKLLDSPQKVRTAISQGMTYQALMIGPFCALFSCLSIWLVPLLFGEEWIISTKLFPFVGMAILVTSIFDLHTATLFALGHNGEVTRLKICYMSVLWIASYVAIKLFGVWGYGIAEIVALPTFYLVHLSLQKLYGQINYANSLSVVLVTILPLFGGIFLEILPSLVLFAVSYVALILLRPDIRKVPVELVNLWRSRQLAVSSGTND